MLGVESGDRQLVVQQRDGLSRKEERSRRRRVALSSVDDVDVGGSSVRSRGEVVCVVGALSGSCIYLVIYDAAGRVQSRDYGEQAAMKMEEFKQGRRESSRGQIQEIWPQAAVGRNLLYASHHLRVHSAVSIMHGGDLHVKTLPLLSPRSADAACNKPESCTALEEV
jgi:hypothetical protein